MDGGDRPELPPEVPPPITRPDLLSRVRSHLIDLTPIRASRQFRLVWIGQSVSDIGSRVTMVAIPFQVFRITGSPFAVGLLGLCQLVPLLGVSVLGGAVADAVDRRRLLIWAHAAFAVTSASLALNAAGIPGELWVLYVAAVVGASLYALSLPALRSAIPRFVDPEQLPAANALTMVYGTFGFLAGPVLGGLLIAWLGLAGAYWVDVATFLWALVMLARMEPIPPHHEAGELGLESIRQGFRFLRGRRVLQSTFTVDLNAMIFGMPSALFPAVGARLGGGAPVVGLLYGAPYAGSFLVNLFSGRAKGVRRQGLAVMVSVVVWGAAIAGFGLSRTLWLSLLLLAVAGGADMWSGIFRSTILQTVVPDELRGRLSGIELAVVASGPSLGDLEAGAVGSLAGIPFAIVSGGLACIAGVGVLAARVPEFARYDARNPTP